MSSEREDLAFASIRELAPKIEEGSISPVELTANALERIARLDPKMNSFLDVWHEESLAAAAIAEEQVGDGTYLGPMHGIPIALKDLVDVAGKATTGGSKVLQSNIATSNATVTNRLNAAGAIIIGKTNLVEFALGSAGVNPYTGDAHNPWDTDKITGGSSSGSGAAVAGGLVYGALGSDTGGSIRMPASLCGIAGIKPTYGRVPRTGVLDLSWSKDHVGPMTRRTADCAHMLNVIAGHDARDIASSTRPVPDFAADLDKGLDGIRIGIPQHYFFDPDIVDPEVLSSVTDAIELLAKNGAEIVSIPMEWVSQGRAINVIISVAEALAVHEKLLAEHADDYTPAVRGRIQAALGMSAIDYIRAQRARQSFSARMAEATEGVDVLVTPSIPVLAHTIAECTPGPGEVLAEKSHEIPLFTSIFDVTGEPSLSVLCGFDSSAMPIGLMISGHAFDEATVLRIGHAYEELASWHSRRPSL
jgi:aspartyl-tRNA(Asn)/glutamyl-tRNA(Gln) amidotransferase subunit A